MDIIANIVREGDLVVDLVPYVVFCIWVVGTGIAEKQTKIKTPPTLEEPTTS